MRRDRLIFVLFGFIYLLTLKYHRKSDIIYLILKIFTFRIVGLLHTSFNYNIVYYRRQAEHMPSICRTNILHALKIRKMTRDETVIRKCFSLKPYMLVKTNLTLKFGCMICLRLKHIPTKKVCEIKPTDSLNCYSF